MNPIVGTPLASIVPNIPDDYVCESRCVEYESDRQLYFFVVFNLALNLGPQYRTESNVLGVRFLPVRLELTSVVPIE